MRVGGREGARTGGRVDGKAGEASAQTNFYIQACIYTHTHTCVCERERERERVDHLQKDVQLVPVIPMVFNEGRDIDILQNRVCVHVLHSLQPRHVRAKAGGFSMCMCIMYRCI